MKRGEDDCIAQNESTAGTSSKATTENKTFRSCCENAIMVRAALYSDDDNRRLTEVISSLTSHLRRWHVVAAKPSGVVTEQRLGGAGSSRLASWRVSSVW